ncbi:MAG: hypothetical protein SOY61_01875 [Campylobacter sp.]|nr:hypothetical protein [Campylobacter sp.]
MARYAKSIALSLLNKKRSAVAPLNARLNIYGEIIPQNHLKNLKYSKIPKRSAIILALNQGQNMEINEKASNFLKELCADIDFSKAGYRPPLKEPLILARFDDKIINKLKDLGYKLENNELKVSTQKQLFHGMRRSKIQEKKSIK